MWRHLLGQQKTSWSQLGYQFCANVFINREEKYVQPVKNFFWDFENLKKKLKSAHFKVHFLRLQIKFHKCHQTKFGQKYKQNISC